MQDAGWVMANGGFGLEIVENYFRNQYADIYAQAEIEGRHPVIPSFGGVDKGSNPMWRTNVYTPTSDGTNQEPNNVQS